MASSIRISKYSVRSDLERQAPRWTVYLNTNGGKPLEKARVNAFCYWSHDFVLPLALAKIILHRAIDPNLNALN